MNIFLVISALIIFTISVIARNNNSNKRIALHDITNTIAQSSIAPSVVMVTTSSPTPTQPISTPLPSNTSTSPNTTNFLSLVYPRAVIVSKDNDTLITESSDDPEVITNWYKLLIKSMGLNTKSFVTTKTNDQVENKLVGAGSSNKISVSISKSSSNSLVRIEVTTQTY